MELEAWLRENPQAPQGIKAHAAALQQLKALGHTQEQMRAWLSTQGLQVSRQAISKFFLSGRATTLQPRATAAQPNATTLQPDATRRQAQCKPTPNPSAARPPGPGAASQTLKARAQATADSFIKNALSPTASRMLRKT